MQAHVEKREQAQHAAEADQLGQVSSLRSGVTAERDQQETQRPIAGVMVMNSTGLRRSSP